MCVQVCVCACVLVTNLKLFEDIVSNFLCCLLCSVVPDIGGLYLGESGVPCQELAVGDHRVLVMPVGKSDRADESLSVQVSNVRT